MVAGGEHPTSLPGGVCHAVARPESERPLLRHFRGWGVARLFPAGTHATAVSDERPHQPPSAPHRPEHNPNQAPPIRTGCHREQTIRPGLAATRVPHRPPAPATSTCQAGPSPGPTVFGRGHWPRPADKLQSRSPGLTGRWSSPRGSASCRVEGSGRETSAFPRAGPVRWTHDLNCRQSPVSPFVPSAQP